jgi:EAL domain-containing protein (putative c-di-GMP-specific phosphodiesterase class I)
MKPNEIIIEIPDEDVDNIDLATLRKSLERLHMHGFKIAVGILLLGHFAMKKLTDLPVSFLRLDGDFIKGLYVHEESKAILGKMLTLANILGVGILSSGVENVAQKKILEDLGCYIMQGPLFSNNYQVQCPEPVKLEH